MNFQCLKAQSTKVARQKMLKYFSTKITVFNEIMTLLHEIPSVLR